MCLRWFRSLRRTGERYLRSNRKIERQNWRSQEVLVVPRSSGWEFSPRIFVILYSSRDPERLEDKEEQARSLQGRDHLHVNVQRHGWKKNDENCFSNAEEVRNYEMKFFKDIGRFWFQGRKRNGMAIPTIKKGQWNCTANKLVQQFKETGHLIFKSTSALSRGILKQKKGRCTIHFNGDSVNTELLFQTVHSVNQLSVYGAVANWCHKFALTEEEKGQVGIICGLNFWPWWNQKKWNCWYLLRPGTWKQDAKRRIELPNTGKGDRAYTTMWISLPPTSCGRREKEQTSTRWRRRMGRNYSIVPRIYEFSILCGNQSFGSNSRRHNNWTGSGSSCCQNSWRTRNRSCNSINCKPREHILRCYIQRRRAFCEWNSWSLTSVQVQQWIARTPSRIRKKWRKESNQTPQGNLGISKYEGNLCKPSHPYSKSIPVHTKNHSYEWEKVESCSCSFTRWKRFGGVSFHDGHNNASTFWPMGTTAWWFETLGFDQTSTDESVCTSRSTSFWWWILVTPDSWWQYQETTPTLPRWRWEFMLFPSYSGTRWWYSNKFRIYEIHAYSTQLERVHLPQRKLVSFSNDSGKWNNSGRKREGQGSPSSLSNTTESFCKGPGRGKASFRSHSSSKSSTWNSLETQPTCCILGTIEEGAGSRVAILANEIIYNHDLRHKNRRLLWPCDCSKRRSSTFRKACDTKTRTQGHVEEKLAKPAAAAWEKPQQPISHTDVPSLWKQRATWESKAEVQDDSKHITEAGHVPGNKMSIHF